MLKPLSEEATHSLTNALLEGRKIEAIKLYRELTGEGLKESKEAIEQIESSLRAKYPEKFANQRRTGGCGGTTLVLTAVAALTIYWFLRG